MSAGTQRRYDNLQVPSGNRGYIPICDYLNIAQNITASFEPKGNLGKRKGNMKEQQQQNQRNVSGD